MRFLVMIKATPKSEAGQMPTKEMVAKMGEFNQTLIGKGAFIDGAGLHPSAKGARISYAGEAPTVTHGPFPNTGELISGYWMLKADSLEEITEWLRSAPFEQGENIEIRPLYEMEDYIRLMQDS